MRWKAAAMGAPGPAATSVPGHLEIVLLFADGPHGGDWVRLPRVLLHGLLPAEAKRQAVGPTPRPPARPPGPLSRPTTPPGPPGKESRLPLDPDLGRKGPRAPARALRKVSPRAFKKRHLILRLHVTKISGQSPPLGVFRRSFGEWKIALE